MKKIIFKKLDLRNVLQEISGHASIGRLDEAGNFMKKKLPSDQEPEQVSPQDDQAAPQEAPPEATQTPAPEAPAAPETAEAPEAPVADVPPQEDTPPPTDSVADSEVDQAEQEIEQPSFVKLNSDSGIKFLLNTILQPAVETNTLDSIAQDFIEKLKINTPDDFQKFKGETIQFRGVSGFNQLISSMENFIA